MSIPLSLLRAKIRECEDLQSSKDVFHSKTGAAKRKAQDELLGHALKRLKEKKKL
jgi:hypothetical protein